MEISGSGDEQRILWLEREVARIRRKLDSTDLIAKAAKQNSEQTEPQGSSQTIFNVITNSAVTARVGAAMGSGTFYFVDSTGGTLTTLTSVGSFTAYTDSSTGWATGKYGRVSWLNGHWEFITADAC